MTPALLPGQLRRVSPGDNSNASPGAAVIEVIGGLARPTAEKVPLAHSAAKDGLNGVNGAGVRLRDAHQLLVRGDTDSQFLLHKFAQPDA